MFKFVPGVEGCLAGYLALEPEKRVMPDGKPVTSIKICLNGDAIKQDGEVVQDDKGYNRRATQWFNCSFFEDLAEVVNTFPKNGVVSIPGYIKVRGWMDKDAEQRNTLDWVYREDKDMGVKGQLCQVKGGVLVPVVVGQPDKK